MQANQLLFLLSVVNSRFTTSLRLSNTNDKPEISKSLTVVTTLLQPFSSLCIVSGNQSMTNFFIEHHLNKSKTLILLETEITQASVYRCECVVSFDVTPQLSNKITYKIFKGAYYFLHLNINLNLVNLRNCFENSSSTEVVVISLLDSSLLELSPIFPFPRTFLKSSIGDVINHRSRSNVDNFEGVHIIGAFMQYGPFTITDSLDAISLDEVDGIEVMIFKELASKLNFTVRLKLYDSWGKDSPNGSWVDGVAYAMHEGLAHIAACGLWQMQVFIRDMDYGPSMAVEEIIFLVRRPEQIDFDWKDVLKIFKIFVWISVLLSFTLTTVVYWYGVSRVRPLYKEDWSGSFLTVFGHFTMSTSHTCVADQVVLTLLTSWSIYSLLLTTVLSTGIVSSLTLPMFSPRVDTIQQLVEDGYYWTTQYYADYATIENREFLFNFKNPWQNLFEKRYVYKTPDEVSEILCDDRKMVMPSQVLNDDFVVLDTDGTKAHKCLNKFRVVKESINRGHVAFGVEKHSPMLEPLTKMTLRFIQTGLLAKWKAEVFERWPEYNTDQLLLETDDLTFNEPEVMPLSKLRPLFYLLLLGLSLASAIFCLEFLWFYA